MAFSLSDQLTAQFYEWEQYGRGWYVFDSAVELEPIFEPFWGHYIDTPYVDDGKRHSIFSYIKEVLAPAKKALPETSPESDVPQAFRYIAVHALRGFSISMPQGEKLKAPEIEKFLVMLSYCQVQVSFEIIATSTSIRLQFVCAEPDALHIQSQLKAYFPTCILQDQTATLKQIVNNDLPVSVIDFGLQQEFTRPLAIDLKFEPDPLTGLFGVLEHLREGEQAAVQILFKGAVNPWAESIMRLVTDGGGDSFFLNAPEMPKLAQEKISSPLFGVVIRVVGQGITEEETYLVTERVSAALVQSSRSTSNMLIPLTNNGYAPADHHFDVLMRESHRAGMILNAREISTFVHYPFSITSKKLERDIRKTKAAPTAGKGQGRKNAFLSVHRRVPEFHYPFNVLNSIRNT